MATCTVHCVLPLLVFLRNKTKVSHCCLGRAILADPFHLQSNIGGMPKLRTGGVHILVVCSRHVQCVMHPVLVLDCAGKTTHDTAPHSFKMYSSRAFRFGLCRRACTTTTTCPLAKVPQHSHGRNCATCAGQRRYCG